MARTRRRCRRSGRSTGWRSACRPAGTPSCQPAPGGPWPSRRTAGSGPSPRPGEWVQIDSAPMDVRVVLDNGLIDRVELTVMIDVATRTIPAAVLRPTTKAVDAALLLARCSPSTSPATWAAVSSAVASKPSRPGMVDGRAPGPAGRVDCPPLYRPECQESPPPVIASNQLSVRTCFYRPTLLTAYSACASVNPSP